LCRGQKRPASCGRYDSAPVSLHQRCADGDAEPAHDNADRRLRYSQPFGGATDMLLLQNSHGDGELRADQLQPFTILINHLKKFIGL